MSWQPYQLPESQEIVRRRRIEVKEQYGDLGKLNKEYGTRLLVSESSALQAGDCGLKPFAETSVRGQSESIRLYTLDSFQPDE